MGSLIQIAEVNLDLDRKDQSPEIIVGMKCAIHNAGYGDRNVFVRFTGSKIGMFATEQEIGDPPCLNIDKLARISVARPGPLNRMWVERIKAGDICYVNGRSDFCMAVSPPGEPLKIFGYLLISGSERGRIIEAKTNIRIGEMSVQQIEKGLIFNDDVGIRSVP